MFLFPMRADFTSHQNDPMDRCVLLRSMPSAEFPQNCGQRSNSKQLRAFTLVELLVVMGIIVVMMAMVGPAMNALKGAGDMTQAASTISEMVQLCRSYAITKNTYVYLGIDEFDSSVADSAVQTRASATAGGRVAMFAITSKDGTRGYTPFASAMSDIKSGWSSNYSHGANFVAVTKLQRYDNLHILNYGQKPPATGNMARPTVANYLTLGNSASDSVTPIGYPVGSSKPTYTFNKVIQFDPEGLLRIAPTGAPTGSPGSASYFSPQAVPAWIEVAFIQTHGNAIPNVTALFPSSSSQNTGNHICLQIDGDKGNVRTFRP